MQYFHLLLGCVPVMHPFWGAYHDDQSLKLFSVVYPIDTQVGPPATLLKAEL